MLEQQTDSQTLLPEVTRADAPKVQKVFGLNKMDFVSFDELINKSSQELNVEYEFFFSNSDQTQWGYMKIQGGKPVVTLPLLEINVISVKKVNPHGLNVDGYLVKYSVTMLYNVTEEYIPAVDMQKNNLLQHFTLPAQCSKKNIDLCNKLLHTIILSKVGIGDKEEYIEIGRKQGFNIISRHRIIYESRDRYPEALHHILPKSILACEKPKDKPKRTLKKEDYYVRFIKLFGDNTRFKILYLLRIASYLTPFLRHYNVEFNQIPVITPSTNLPACMLNAFLKNDSFSSNDVITLGSKLKEVETAISLKNGTLLLIDDETKADEPERRKATIKLLENAVVSHSKDSSYITVIISKYAATEIRPDLCCRLHIGEFPCCLGTRYVKVLLKFNDFEFISAIEAKPNDFLEACSSIFTEVSLNVPHSIPVHRRNSYIVLVTAARLYNEFYDYFFNRFVEEFVVEWLSDYDESPIPIDDGIITDFGNLLNQEINSGKFSFVKRKKFIVFDKESNIAIVDDNNIYFETSAIRKLVNEKMQCLRSFDHLTDILNKNKYLEINDTNSKCYRFHVHNSNDEPYMLYTYGISKNLINAENRKRLDLADYQKFLFNYAELEEKMFLPLGITSDGNFISKDISYNNKSNDSIILTGQSGKGKTFCATNLLPSLAMLGSRLVVLDVSGSFTRNEVLRALPEQVIDELFEFIEVAVGKRKLPVDPLFIGDCIGLPAKKRRMVGFVKAIAGKLDKEESKTLAGIFSEMFKKNPKISSVSTEMLRNTLKRGGKVGNHVYNLISSTLDDIDNIGFEKQGWAEFFEKTKKIPVISYGYESGDNVHSLLDVLISSVFEWQRDHDTAPLNVVVDEIKDQNFAEGSPLHTILTQGRKFNTKFIGMTQQYISTSSHAIDVVKEAGIKIFFKPSKSLERIASELGYKNPTDAGFGSMGIGDFILSCDCYNKVDCVNEPVVIHCKTIKFVDTPLYKRFETEYLT